MTDKQTQKAGNNSRLIQVETVIVGVDEKRVREVIDEKLNIALQNFTSEAANEAKNRAEKFNKSLIQRMVQENALTAFSDPSFQILLIEAQKRAASTEREPDYNLLSELMVHRFKKGSNRIVRAGISRAVEIVDQISSEALLGITVFHSASYFAPIASDMAQGLKILDDLFGKIIYDVLPTNTEWLDHLDVLDAVRITSFGNTKLFEDYWGERFNEYLKKGIEENSEKHNEAKLILKDSKLGENCLVKDVFNEKYLKLNVLDKNQISQLVITNSLKQSRPLTIDEKSALEKVYDLYDGTKMSREDFIKVIDGYPNIKKLREWWNTLNHQSIQITSVGRVLAHSNAQRVDKSLPPLN